MPRRKLARVGDRIRFSGLNGTCEGTVTEMHSEYMNVKLDAPRKPYYHELAMGFKPMDLMRDTVRRHAEYTITRYMEETR